MEKQDKNNEKERMTTKWTNSTINASRPREKRDSVMNEVFSARYSVAILKKVTSRVSSSELQFT